MTSLPYTLETIRGVVAESGLSSTVPFEGVLTITIPEGARSTLLGRLAEVLSPTECDDTRALLLPAGAALDLRALLAVERLAVLIQRCQSDWLIDVLDRRALVTHFQPIVPSEAPDHIFGFEALTRGIEPDGDLIPPMRMYEAATSENLRYHLDRAARLNAIRSADQFGIVGKVFINFLPSAIYTPEYCLRSTFAAMRGRRLRPDQVVFEVVESERIHDTSNLEGILRAYRDEGFGIALDDMGAGYASLGLLHALRPDYIKIDRSLVQSPYKATIAARLLETASELGLPSIAEGVETEAEWRWLRDHGATYQQGYLFARPTTPPPPVNEIPVAS
jgi:EAL domain-containing protein (putative c-di-GMP-specific phosphodiesterase class I)